MIYACGACVCARGVARRNLEKRGARLGNQTMFVSPVEREDRVSPSKAPRRS
jgi:hypothetical protein